MKPRPVTQTRSGLFYFGGLSGRNLTRLITLRGIEAGGPTRKLEKAGTQTGAGAKSGQVEPDLSGCRPPRKV